MFKGRVFLNILMKDLSILIYGDVFGLSQQIKRMSLSKSLMGWFIQLLSWSWVGRQITHLLGALESYLRALGLLKLVWKRETAIAFLSRMGMIGLGSLLPLRLCVKSMESFSSLLKMMLSRDSAMMAFLDLRYCFGLKPSSCFMSLKGLLKFNFFTMVVAHNRHCQRWESCLR